MKNIQKIALLSLLSISSLIFNNSEKNDRFQPHSTNEFSYVSMQTDRPMKAYDIQLHQPVVISEKTQKNSFNTGIIRIRVTETTQNNNTIVTTTEIWRTKNPSYITWTNAALISALIAAGILTNYIQVNSSLKIFVGDERYFNGKWPRAIRNDEKHAINEALKHGFISEKNAEVLWDNEVKRYKFLNKLEDEYSGVSKPYQKKSFFDNKWYQKKYNQYLSKCTEYPAEEIEFDFTNK